jgi:hypothetical protein
MEFSETLRFDAHTHSARILCGLYSQQGVDLGSNTSWKSNPGNLIWIFFYGQDLGNFSRVIGHNLRLRIFICSSSTSFTRILVKS